MKRSIPYLIASALVVVVIGAFFHHEKVERKKVDILVFDQMRESAWALNGEFLFGYFYTSPKRSSLETLAGALERFGYRKVNVYKDEQKKFWWLHVERIEHHDLDSMAARNVRLKWLGTIFGGSVYDGWDAGRVPENKEANKSVVQHQ